MKKLLLSALVLIGLTSTSQAQTFSIVTSEDQSTNLAGSVHNVMLTAEQDYEGIFYITRTDAGQTPISVKLTRKQLATPSTIELEELCWGPSPDPLTQGTCYPVPTDEAYWEPSSFKTITQKGLMEIHLLGMTLPATVKYRYYIEDESGAKLDSMDIHLSSVLSVKEVKNPTQALTFSAYPVPANDYLTVGIQGATSGESYSVKMVDVLGKVVLEDRINGTKKIDVSGLNNGVYVLSYYSNNKTIQSKRIIIKH